MVLLFSVLTDHSVYDSLENIFLGYDALHILDKIVGLSGLVILQVIYHEVESGFWDHIHYWR